MSNGTSRIYETPRDVLLRLSLALSPRDKLALDHLMRQHSSLSVALRSLIREYGKDNGL